MFLFQSSQEKKLKQDAKNQMEVCLRSFDQRTQDKYKKSMEFLSKHIQKNNQDIIEIVVDNIKATIKDDQLPPVRKYQAIKLLRDLMKIQIKNKNKALGKYVLKKIFKRLVILAQHNAGSNDEDRGKDIFKNVKKDQQKYSILFLNQLLLSIEQWAKTWPGVSQGMKKQFNEAYKQLLTNGVKFPKQIVKGPQNQGYRGQDGNRNSLSGYSSVPKRQSFSKNDEKSQMRSVSIDEKPRKNNNISQSVSQSMGRLNQKKVKQYFKQIMSPIEEFLSILNEMQSGDDSQMLAFLNDMIGQLRTVIFKGDSFCTQLSPEEMKSDYLGKGVISALNFSEGTSKDIKILLKHGSQFSKFKTKYLKIGNQLLKGLKGILNNQKNQTSILTQKSKSQIKVQIKKPQNQKQPKKANQQEQITSAKKLNVPRVSSQNVYSSSSGQPNNWVIKQRSQYNSNSNKDQVEAHQKFGSFGIGGIGDKLRNQSKEKSNFANKASTQRPGVKFQAQNQDKKIETHKEIPLSKQVSAENQNKNINKDNTFGSFKISSDQNSKPQQNSDYNNQQFPNVKGKTKAQQVKDSFDQSGFQQQQKIQAPIEEKPSSLQESANFFGQFGNQKNVLGLPRVNRNQRKMRSGPTTKQFEVNDNPFQNNMNSQIGSETQNYSAFNKDKPSFSGQVSQNQVLENSTSAFQKDAPHHSSSLESKDRKKSFDDPFANSFELNKSNRNSYDDKNPNFWDGEPSKQNQSNNFDGGFTKKRNSQSKDDSQNLSNNQSKPKVQNPFENPQFSKRASKSINPFQDDSKSQVSQKNRSSVLNFEMNKSFTKSQKQNPFENPFQTTSQNLSKTNQQPSNPFQTSKDQFKPPKQPPKYQSVSQQGSFKRVNLPENKAKNISIENPFETMTENKSEVYDPKQLQNMNQSWKFSIKDKQSNQGFDFDQFQSVSGPQRNSVDTSSFPAVRESFDPSGTGNQIASGKRMSTEIPVKNENENQKSIHFSQFGDQTDKNASGSVMKKQGSKKSFNFSDFGGFEDKPVSKNGASQFQGFNDSKIEKKKQKLNAFELSKNQSNDLFRETQRSQRGVKVEDNKSNHSGFSAFNMNADNKSQQNNRSSVGWDDFGKFQRSNEGSNIKFDDFQRESSEFPKKKDQSNVFGTAIQTERYPNESQGINNFIDKNQLRLQFSETTSKYHSPQFNQKYDTVSQSQQESQFNMMNSLKKVDDETKNGGQSVKFEQFVPIEKKGYAWNPMGLKPQRDISKIMICSQYDIQQKKREVQYYERMYKQERELISKAKQVYNQARKVYLQKIAKIDSIIKQKQSYRQILISLKESNENKEEEIFMLNERIKQVSDLKEKILEKEKIFFEKTKTIAREDNIRNLNNRTNSNKWEIFNRNLKMMRERELQQNEVNFSKTGHGYS